ncbi:hypothetical protein IW150_001189, partial [Coemansia sp. RSA 2607]
MASEESTSKLDTFVKWLLDNGADLSRIELRDAGADGNGVYAREDIPEDTRYAYIPHTLAITGKVCHAALSTASQAGDCGLRGRPLLAAFLVHQRFVCADSFWKPYIDILPAQYHTPLEFSDAELQILVETPAEHSVEDRRQKYADEHRSAVTAVGGKIGGALTFANYVWAASAVCSRSFSKDLVKGSDELTESSEVLLPLLDMMNHLPRRRVSWICDDSGIEFVTGQLLRRGEQVYNNYGPKSNEELMLGYGFCVPDNPFSHFHLRLNYARDPRYEDKQAVLERFGIAERDQYIRRDELPRDLLPMLRVLAMSDVDLHYAAQLEEGMLEFFGLCNELRARHLLLFLLEKKLAVFDAAEEGALAAADSENARVARAYRSEIGLILRATIERLVADEQRLMRYACGLTDAQTSLPWYARPPSAEFIPPNTASQAESPAAKRPRTDIPLAELEQNFVSHALLTTDSFACDEEFADALEQIDVEEDVALALFIVRALLCEQSACHARVKRLEHLACPMDDYELEDVHASLFPLLSEHFPEVFSEEEYSLERFVWAAGLVEAFKVEFQLRSSGESVE